MDNLVKILLAVIAAIVIIGGTVTAVNLMNNDSNALDDDNGDSSVDDTDDVKNATFVDDGTDSSDNDSDVVSEEVKFNYQDGEGYYREVTYKDGGFRQFDVDTGELIGSSYDSDQDKLPNLE